MEHLSDDRPGDHWRGNGQPTMGEIHRLLLEVRTDVKSIDGVVDALNMKHVALEEKALTARRDLDALKASNTWAWRASALALLTGASGLAAGLVQWALTT